MGSIFDRQVYNTAPIYRYVNVRNGDRLSTTNYNELKGGNDTWKYECITGYAYTTPVYGSMPVYRYNNGREHFLTTSSTEVANGRNGFRSEGIAFYIVK
jgi:hypothetical protein